MLNVKKLLTKLMTTQTGSATRVGTVWDSGNINLYRNGGSVTLKFNGAHLGSTSSRTQIGTVPTGFRPPCQIAEKTDASIMVIVEVDGKLKVDPPTGGTYYTSVTYTWGGVIRQLLSTLATAFVRKGVAVC